MCYIQMGNNGILKNQKEIFRKFFESFAQLSEVEWQEISNELRELRIAKGSNFITSGEISGKIGFIVQGCMRYFYLKDGEEITGEFWREGEVVGSFESIFLQLPSTQTIQALEEVNLMVIDYSNLGKLFAKYHNVETIGRKILEKLIVESQQRIASYIMDTPLQRYLKLRDEMPGIENRVPQKFIASFIGVTPVSLSRIRKRLANKS